MVRIPELNFQLVECMIRIAGTSDREPSRNQLGILIFRKDQNDLLDRWQRQLN
jgi:hypothetical protein